MYLSSKYYFHLLVKLSHCTGIKIINNRIYNVQYSDLYARISTCFPLNCKKKMMGKYNELATLKVCFVWVRWQGIVSNERPGQKFEIKEEPEV